MTIDDILQSVRLETDQYLYLIVLALLLLAIVLFLSRKSIKQSLLNRKTRRCLNKLGLKQMSNIRFPDGLGHYFIIDRLLLRHDGISLVMLKRYPGSIYCADNIDEWSQLLRGKSYYFKNPLVDLEYQVNIVSACIPGVPVNGFLFFDHQAYFPKGHPDRVIQLDSLPPSLIRDKKVKAQAAVESAWEKLRRAMKK